MRDGSEVGVRVADTLARQLSAAGVRHAFGIPGGEVLTLIDALGAAGIEYITARHETAAGLMAEGTWTATGAPGLLIVTVGPGVSNAVNAIANAYLDRVPLIVVSGAVDADRPGQYTHQVFDQRALLRPIVKASFVAAPETVERDIAHALQLASTHPRGPVHIDLPIEVARAMTLSSTLSPPHPQPAAPERAALVEAAAWLANAKRPLVIAGLEAIDDQVANPLAALVRVHHFPLLTTYKAKGILDEDSLLCIGAVALSPRADALVRPLIQAADVVLLVGYDPVEMRAGYAQPFAPHTRIIELAPSAREHQMHAAHLQINGDLSTSVIELAARVGSRQQQAWPDGEPAHVRSALRSAFAVGAGSGFTPLAVADVLARKLPDAAQLTIDTGAHRILLSQALRARRPGQILQSNGLCTMGYALPCAIGVALASNRRVIAAMGDGGFEMLLGELATVRDLRLPLIIVVFDDSSLALIDQKQSDAGLTRRGVWLGRTDHVALARAFGGRGVRVQDAEALERAFDAALAEREHFSVISCALQRGAYAGLL
jgi:acetolactate synthase-1/2/3 large subunit